MLWYDKLLLWFALVVGLLLITCGVIGVVFGQSGSQAWKLLASGTIILLLGGILEQVYRRKP